MNQTNIDGCKVNPRTIIQNCNLTGVEFTKGATESIIACAKALQANAEACEANALAIQEFAKIMNMSGMSIPLITIHGDDNSDIDCE